MRKWGNGRESIGLLGGFLPLKDTRENFESILVELSRVSWCWNTRQLGKEKDTHDCASPQSKEMKKD